jgi:hypothetical protein
VYSESIVSTVLVVEVLDELSELDELVLSDVEASAELLWSVVVLELLPEKIDESEGSIMESAMTTAMTAMAILAPSESPPCWDLALDEDLAVVLVLLAAELLRLLFLLLFLDCLLFMAKSVPLELMDV